MGCASSKGDQYEAKKQPESETTPPQFKDTSPCGPNEGMVREHPQVKLVKDTDGSQYYALRQTFAIVRHGDRLDHTDAWEKFPDRERWPNDTPLTEAGHKHATEVGKKLKQSGGKFGLIICSPYYRCAQTASRIAEVLNLPIHFDLDIGEVFDNVSMKGNIKGLPQHREPAELEKQLAKTFPKIQYIRDDGGGFKIDGKLQKFPEKFDAARMRYCYKVKKLVQRAASELMDIVIVTHGDALAAVIGLLREDWQITSVPYTANAVCSRQVKVLVKGTEEILQQEPVYTHPEEWKVECSKGFDHKRIGAKDLGEAHQVHEHELKAMNDQERKIKTDYVLHDEQVKAFQEALQHLDAHDHDTSHMMKKVGSSHHMANDRDNRVHCSPHAKAGT